MTEHIEKMKEIGLQVKDVKAVNPKVAQMIKDLCENDMGYFPLEAEVLCDKCIAICLVAEVDCAYMLELKEKQSSNLKKGCYAFINACLA